MCSDYSPPQRPSEENNMPCLFSKSKCACIIRSWCTGKLLICVHLSLSLTTKVVISGCLVSIFLHHFLAFPSTSKWYFVLTVKTLCYWFYFLWTLIVLLFYALKMVCLVQFAWNSLLWPLIWTVFKCFGFYFYFFCYV